MKDAFDRLMYKPGLLLAALGASVAAEWIIVTPLGQDWIPGYAALVAEWVRVAAMWLFLCWSVAVQVRDGEEKMFGLWGVWFAGWALVVSYVARHHPCLPLHDLNRMLVPYGWWGTMGGPWTPGECYLALGILAVVLDVCSGMRGTKILLLFILGLLCRVADALDR